MSVRGCNKFAKHGFAFCAELCTLLQIYTRGYSGINNNTNTRTQARYVHCPFAMESHDTWLNMTTKECDSIVPACITCGVQLASHRKRYRIHTLIAIARSLLQKVKLSTILTTSLNVFEQRAKVSLDCSMCLSCFHWVDSRQVRCKAILPLFSLHAQIVVLSSQCKRVDTRIIHKLACNITEKGNFYANMFEKDELQLFHTIAADSMRNVKMHMIAFWDSRNGFSLFVQNAKIAEMVRENCRKKNQWQLEASV